MRTDNRWLRNITSPPLKPLRGSDCHTCFAETVRRIHIGGPCKTFRQIIAGKAEVIGWDDFETKQRTKRGETVFCYTITSITFHGVINNNKVVI